MMSTTLGPRMVRVMALTITVLLLAPLIPSMVPMNGPSLVRADPPTLGDWTVSGHETLSDKEVTLTGNLTVPNGATLEMDNVTMIMNCTFNGQFNITVEFGGDLILRNSTVTPIDWLQRYRYNFRLGLGSSAELYDSTFEAIGVGNLSQPSTLGLYIETSGAKVVNNMFTRRNILYMSSAIVVGPLVSPRIEGNDISGLYPTGITLLLGSSSVIKDNDITASGIGILCLFSSPKIISNDLYSNLVGVQLTSCDAKLVDNYIDGSIFAGITADNSELTLNGDSFVDNANDIILNASSVHAVDIGMTGGANGIDIDNCFGRNINIIDSILSTSGGTVLTVNRSVANFLNTTLDRDKVSLLSQDAEVHVSWYVDISVEYAGGGPVGQATITMTDQSEQTVYQGQTDMNGMVEGLKIEEYNRIGDDWSNRTPHIINVSKPPISASVEVVVDSSQYVEIVIDDMAPLLTVTEPVEGLMTNISVVEFRGNATDNDLVSVVEYRLEGQSWGQANGTETWNFTLDLPDGDHTVTVKAMDRAGNTGTAVVNLTVDTIAPTLTITRPTNGSLTNTSPIKVEGKVERGADLYLVALNGSLIELEPEPDGDFSFDHELTEGTNIITLMARDEAWNQVERSVEVELDTISPTLDVLGPEDGLLSASSSIRVHGTTEVAALVTINGLPITVDDNGSFEHVMTVADGDHIFKVVSKDRAGNAISEVRNVTVDTTPPKVEVTSPEDGLLTNVTLVRVQGQAQALDVFVGGIWADTTPSQEEGWWEFDELYPLQEGANLIEVEAVDEAGNNRSVLISVILDTTLPFLNITEPKDGAKTRNGQITVTGSTEPGATLELNGELISDSDGTYSVPVPLEIGDNLIIITATDEAGNTNEVSITVTREKRDISTTDLSSNYSLLMFLIILMVIGVFLLSYNYAMAGKTKDKKEEDEDDQPDEEDEDDRPDKEDEEGLEEMEMDGEDEGSLGRGSMVLTTGPFEPTPFRDSSDLDFSPRPRHEEVMKGSDEEPRPKKKKKRKKTKKGAKKRTKKKKSKKKDLEED